MRGKTHKGALKMSKISYSEVEPTDSEITDYIDDIYYEPVMVCGMEMTQSYILKNMDEVAFYQYGSNNMRWYKCDICDTIYKDDGAEDKAIECCQNHCVECGKEIDDDPDYYVMCDDCKAEQEDIDSESDE